SEGDQPAMLFFGDVADDSVLDLERRNTRGGEAGERIFEESVEFVLRKAVVARDRQRRCLLIGPDEVCRRGEVTAGIDHNQRSAVAVELLIRLRAGGEKLS